MIRLSKKLYFYLKNKFGTDNGIVPTTNLSCYEEPYFDKLVLVYGGMDLGNDLYVTETTLFGELSRSLKRKRTILPDRGSIHIDEDGLYRFVGCETLVISENCLNHYISYTREH